MGHQFCVPTPVTPKPRLERKPSVARLHLFAGCELAHGHSRTAEHLAEVAERLRERLAPEAMS